MPKRLLGGLSNWTMGNLMTVLTRDRAARPYLSTRKFAPALRTAVPCRGTASLTVASSPNPPLPSLLILDPIPLCPPALPTHPLHRLHSSHPSCHTRSPPRQRPLCHVSSNSHTRFSVSPLSPCSLYWIPFRPTSSSLYRTYMYPFPPYASPTPPCSLSFPAACLRTSCVDSPGCLLFSAYSFPTPFPPTTRPSLLVLSSLLVLHDRRPSPHTLTPFTAEVLTRVMRLGLESDSSHYFCDL